MPRSFARHQLEVQRATITTDRYGETVLDWTNPSSHTIDRCVVDPVVGTETFDAAGRRVVSRWRALGPVDADLTTDDRIIHQGHTYDIDGEVERYDSPTGRVAHFEVTLMRSSGGAADG